MSDRSLDAERVFARVAKSMLGENVAPPSIGRYEVRERLGAGAMGEVYSAFDPEHDREVALKLLHNHHEADPKAQRRLVREARALEKLTHDNVVRVFEVGAHEGRVFIAMERLEGAPLDAHLEQHGRLSPDETLALVRDVGGAIDEAHGHGIVHRDLKPGNIFVRPNGSAKVLDFGVAKGLSSGTLGASTASGAVLGTPFYMSPEQATDSSKIDHRSDLWALGVIVYECLIGTRPFTAKNVSELTLQIVTGEPPKPSARGDVPPGFDAWFERALARDPTARFQTAADLADALAQAFAAERPSFWQRLLRLRPARR